MPLDTRPHKSLSFSRSSLGMRTPRLRVLLLVINLFYTHTLAANFAVAAATITTTTTAAAAAAGAEASTADTDPAVAVLLEAGSLAWAVIRLLVIGILRVIMLVLWPVLAIVGMLWRMLVVAPWELFMSIAHVLYPVVLFCIAAVLCGTVIGGCAGFVAEAVSWFTVTATWGRQTTRKPLVLAIDQYDHDDDRSVESYQDQDTGEDTDIDAAVVAADAISKHARATDKKGKPPLQRPSSPRHYPAAASPPSSPRQGLFNIGRAAVNEHPEEYEDEWAWGDEEDLDVFPRRRRWRRSVG